MKISHKITDLFSDRLWTIDTSQSSKFYSRIVRFVKLVRITLDAFVQNNVGFQGVALSYYTTFAMVPFLAFLFAVMGGLGLSIRLDEMIAKLVPAGSELSNIIMSKADSLLDFSHGGVVGVISAFVFLWAIIMMLMQVERVFNNVWGVRRIRRKLYKRFSFYFLILILSPFIVILFGTGIAFYTNLPNLLGMELSNIEDLPVYVGYLIFYAITTMTLSVMFKFIPTPQVKYRFAFKSAAVTAIIFILFQYLYLETQVFVGRINSIYGVLAAIPLFLTWLNMSWQIILYGAELTFGLQNIDAYNTPKWDSETK